MIEILLMLLVFWPLMAKHGKKRRYNPNFRVIRFAITSALTALGSANMVIVPLVGSADGQYRTIAMDTYWGIRGLTPGEGPIQFGFNHSDYTATEVKEWFDSASAISVGNKIENERSRRICRQSGQFSGITAEEVVNDGKVLRTKFRMKAPLGTTPELWVRNGSGATLTTGAVVTATGKMYVIDY